MRHGGVLLHDVVPQFVRPREALRALGAHERPFARVRPVVPLQVRQPQERQVAVRALVRLQPGMRLHVPPEVLLVQERSLARRTLDRGADHLVLRGLHAGYRLEVHLERLILGLRQYGRGLLVVANVLVHHHLRAEHVRVVERGVVVRRVVVVARNSIRPGFRIRGAADAAVRLKIFFSFKPHRIRRQAGEHIETVPSCL